MNETLAVREILQVNEVRMLVAESGVDFREFIADHPSFFFDHDSGKVSLAKNVAQARSVPNGTVKRAELMTGGGWFMYASANFERLVLGCIKA